MGDDVEGRVLLVRRIQKDGDVGARDLYLIPRTVGKGVTLAQLLILRLEEEVAVRSSLHGFLVHQQAPDWWLVLAKNG
jgi:hypothetical protein